MGPGGRAPGDMGPGPSPGHHNSGGPRRRPQYQQQQQQQQQQQYSYAQHNPNQPIYYQTSHMNPYASAYYPQVPPHYPPATMPGAPYMPYAGYTRSPPAMHQQYPSIVSSSMSHPPQPYSRPPPQQPSPAIATPPPYAMPHPPPPVPIPQTPSSTHSSQAVQAPLTPPTPQSQEVAPPQPEVEVLPARAPFRPPVSHLHPSCSIGQPLEQGILTISVYSCHGCPGPIFPSPPEQRDRGGERGL
jgi:ubiquitin carboxyl-terminal hydrolase 10